MEMRKLAFAMRGKIRYGGGGSWGAGGVSGMFNIAHGNWEIGGGVGRRGRRSTRRGVREKDGRRGGRGRRTAKGEKRRRVQGRRRVEGDDRGRN